MKRNLIWLVVIIIVAASLVYLLGPSRTPSAPQAAQGNVPMPATYALNVGTDAKLGNYLTAANGMTLYTFAQDEPGKSNCNNQCALVWPPYAVSASDAAAPNATGTISTIFRADGAQQMAYNGWPLYFYKGDAKPGDTNGDGVGNIWFVAKP